MRTLRDKTDEHKGRETKIIQKTGRRTKHKRLKYGGQLRVTGGVMGGGGWAKWVRGIKESAPEIIVALFAN